jgi:outer membrane protein assembly factor BamB
LAATALACCASPTWAADWPQWRYDAARGAITPDRLPERLSLVWQHRLPTPRPAWPASQPWLRFDVSYTPVAAGGLLFVPSMANDSLTAYDLASGVQRWRFYAEGPIRLAPVAAGDCVLFGSDDGYLYCLQACSGQLRWRVRGGPSDRRLLGNERLVSTWPVHTGPVVHDGIVYFAAGIWPFMGIFVRAVDVQTGRPIWTNSGAGADWCVQPHRSPAFSGFAPRGYLAADDLWLIVAGGRTQPACYDRQTGALRYFDFGPKNAGTWAVGLRTPSYFTGSQMVRVEDGKPVLDTTAVVHDHESLFGLEGDALCAWRLTPEEKLVPAPVVKTTKSSKKPPATKPVKSMVRKSNLKLRWRAKLEVGPQPRLMFKAADDFVLAGPGWVAAVRATDQASQAEVRWRAPIDGDPWDALVADGRLVLVTTTGQIDCFGAPGADQPVTPTSVAQRQHPSSDPRAAEALQAAGTREGYALVFGADAALVEGLVGRSSLHVIAVESNTQRVDALRRRLDGQGLYGTRAAAITDHPAETQLPPYVAALAVVEPLPADEPQRAAQVRRVFHSLRPYGGAALFLAADSRQLATAAQRAGLERFAVKACRSGALLTRVGALPGAADWTHQYADAANSVVSHDRRVRLPLGLLWFGGPSNDDVLPRHGHGPSPQVAQGRLVIEGPNMLRAIDIYTGRLLWQVALPGLGKFYDNTKHQPGANLIGSNYVTLADRVYVARGTAILVLDAATGRTVQEIPLEPARDGTPSYAGYLAAIDDLLLATAASTPYQPSSPRLIVFDRHTGRRLWERAAVYGFRHNAICAGGGRIYLVDARPLSLLELFKRRGNTPSGPYCPQLLALDARSGRVVWNSTDHVFGTFLNYSAEYDVLLEAGSVNRDRPLDDAPQGMAVYHAANGRLVWRDLQRRHNGPCLLHHDTIIAQGPAYALLTGEPRMRTHPLTDELLPWKFTRNYGCNTVIGCENLITFRSAAAGYFDLTGDGGTGNLGGFKSSCTSNLIAAGGLLVAPDYTRTCTCRYQNQTSLAMVYDPQAEVWTFNSLVWDGQRVRRVGINLGAAGDRRADNGTLWLEWPSRGSPSPDLPVAVEPADAVPYRQHSTLVRSATADGLAWVAASGLRGARRISITLSRDPVPERPYTVVLHFAEPEALAPGQRVFDVRVQGRPVLTGLDLAGVHGSMKAVAYRCATIPLVDRLQVDLEPRTALPPVISGIEILAEGW